MKNNNKINELFCYLKGEKLSIAFVLVLLIASIVLELLLPIQIKDLFSEDSMKAGVLFRYLAVLFGIITATSVVKYVYSVILFKLTNNISAKIQQNLIKNIIGMDYLSFLQYDKGQILNRFTNDLKAVEQILKDIFPSVFRSVIYIVSAAVILFTMNKALCIIALSAVGLYLLAFAYLNEKIVVLYRKNVHLNDEMVENTQDVINGVKDIKIWRILNKVLLNYMNMQKRYFGNKLLLNSKITVSKEIYAFIKGIGTIFVIGMGTYFISSNTLTFGELFAFTMYLNSLYTPAIDLLDASNDYSRCMSNIERIFELNTDRQHSNKGLGRMVDSIDTIEYLDVSFAFNDKIVLENVSFKLEKGCKYALIGKTGEGKSTLLNIILGLYNPISGKVRINDSKEISFDEYDADELNINAILQDSYVFNRSLLDNIAMYGEESIDTKMTKSCIEELRDRLSEKAGQNGNGLSGGQRQRLLLTRIFDNKSKILILDESTSALDAKTEKEILDHVFDEYNDSIIILCSHQQQAINYADYILSLEDRNVTMKDAG